MNKKHKLNLNNNCNNLIHRNSHYNFKQISSNNIMLKEIFNLQIGDAELDISIEGGFNIIYQLKFKNSNNILKIAISNINIRLNYTVIIKNNDDNMYDHSYCYYDQTIWLYRKINHHSYVRNNILNFNSNLQYITDKENISHNVKSISLSYGRLYYNSDNNNIYNLSQEILEAEKQARNSLIFFSGNGRLFKAYLIDILNKKFNMDFCTKNEYFF